MKENKRKYITVMVIGLVLNIGLYSIAHFYHLPVWMDTIGTCYVAVLLEPAAGVLIGFLMNFYQAVFIYNYTSIIYFISSAAAAVVAGVCMRKAGRHCWRRLPLTVLLVIVVNTAVSSILTIWRGGGVSDSAWEHYFMKQAMEEWGFSMIPACIWGTFVLKLLDGAILLAALGLLFAVTPKRLRVDELPSAGEIAEKAGLRPAA